MSNVRSLCWYKIRVKDNDDVTEYSSSVINEHLLTFAICLLLSTPTYADHHNAHHHPHDHSMAHHHRQEDPFSFFGGEDQDDAHGYLKPHTHIAYHHVENACREDVQELCTVEEPDDSSNSIHSFRDPLLDWIFLPPQQQTTRTPSPFQLMIDRQREIDSIMDQMFDVALRVPSTYFVMIESSTPSYEHHQFLRSSNQNAEPEPPTTLLKPDHVVDSVVSKLAQETPDEEIPLLARQIVQQGKKFLHHPDDDRRRLARRLTQVEPDSLKKQQQQQHKVRLPFGCHQNRCLKTAASEGRVSPKCANAMAQLDYVAAMELEMEERQDLFVGLLWIYVGLLFLLLALVARRFRQNKQHRRLRHRILQAIYSNPKIKAEVEESLGEPLGSVPPVSEYVLRLMSSGGAALQQRIKCLRRVQLVVFAGLSVMVIVAPFWVLPACIVISAARALVLLCSSSSRGSVRECSCCCCGATTTDAARGTLTEAQECCSCCKGTGVCAPGCADCCGGGSDPCTCCNSGDSGGCCCCCGNPKSCDYPGNRRQTSASCCAGCCCCCCCCGTESCSCCSCGGTGKAGSVTINKERVSCCDGCCCCGAQPGQLAAGTLTDAQACCCCCNGTGIPCCSCCNARGTCNFKTDKEEKLQCCDGCCCCGAQPGQLAAGTLTDAQACCCCCSGTGACCCCSCCGSETKKGRGQKHVVKSRQVIYQGVPVQIV